MRLLLKTCFPLYVLCGKQKTSCLVVLSELPYVYWYYFSLQEILSQHD